MKSGNEGSLPDFDMGGGAIRGLSSKVPSEKFEAEERKRVLEAYKAARQSAKDDSTPIYSITRADLCWNDALPASEDYPPLIRFTKIHWGCQQSKTFTQGGTFPVKRVQTTHYTTIFYHIELPSFFAPAKLTARHIVECPGCMNILSFDIIPAEEDDKNRKFSLWRFLFKSGHSKPRCKLTHGDRFDNGRRRPNKYSNALSPTIDLYSDSLYFHKVQSLELNANGSIREKAVRYIHY